MKDAAFRHGCEVLQPLGILAEVSVGERLTMATMFQNTIRDGG